MQNRPFQKQQIRFRRWSRKGYAIFCSLGKCISIGNLTKGIIDASLPKQKSVNHYFTESKIKEKDYQGENPLDPHPDSIPLITLLSPCLLTIYSSIQNEYCKLYQIITVKKKPDECIIIYPSGFFFP